MYCSTCVFVFGVMMDPNSNNPPAPDHEPDGANDFDRALERDVEALDALALDALTLEEDDGLRDDEW